jgi:hypothetical protein
MISDDDLLLYYYRDGLEPAERARIGAALAEHPELAQRLHRLVGRLDAAAAIPEVPVPADTQQRWRTALEQAAHGQTTHAPRSSGKRFTHTRWLAAAAMLIAVVWVIQFTRQPPMEQTAEVPAPANASAYERGLKSHLASTEQQLASLESASPEERAQLVQTIIGQNRIYALAAERAGQPQLARVLRAFSPILENLQAADADPSANVAQLAFELRVMQGRLDADTASGPGSATL